MLRIYFSSKKRIFFFFFLMFESVFELGVWLD